MEASRATEDLVACWGAKALAVLARARRVRADFIMVAVCISLANKSSDDKQQVGCREGWGEREEGKNTPWSVWRWCAYFCHLAFVPVEGILLNLVEILHKFLPDRS